LVLRCHSLTSVTSVCLIKLLLISILVEVVVRALVSRVVVHLRRVSLLLEIITHWCVRLMLLPMSLTIWVTLVAWSILRRTLVHVRVATLIHTWIRHVLWEVVLPSWTLIVLVHVWELTRLLPGSELRLVRHHVVVRSRRVLHVATVLVHLVMRILLRIHSVRWVVLKLILKLTLGVLRNLVS
jgi:hypothetical protein